MIICKRLVHPDDHLQEASPSRSSFARGFFVDGVVVLDVESWMNMVKLMNIVN